MRRSKAVNGKTPEMWAVARALQQLVPEHTLYLPEESFKAARVFLSPVPGSHQYKNAVTVKNSFVRFCVPDWSIEDEVKAKGFETEQIQKNSRYRLNILKVDEAAIEANKDLFTRLMQIAVAESEDRMRSSKAAR